MLISAIDYFILIRSRLFNFRFAMLFFVINSMQNCVSLTACTRCNDRTKRLYCVILKKISNKVAPFHAYYARETCNSYNMSTQERDNEELVQA